MSKQIQLSKGKYTIVDDEDFEYLNQWKWCVNSAGYAVRTVNFKTSSGKKTTTTIRMHRVILKPLPGMQVDHIDNDKLNNQKSNLRECTNEENGRNKGLPNTNSSGFKGVEKRNRRWRAAIKVSQRKIHLGFFSCPIEAARAYNAAALKYHGEFAKLNEIPAI